ncbi:MAG: hypothetical protein JRI97_08715 [Deltaproteobacteria bacterium]|nr:hypothetical protein [Deltaproteobacteria bacterium]
MAFFHGIGKAGRGVLIVCLAAFFLPAAALAGRAPTPSWEPQAEVLRESPAKPPAPPPVDWDQAAQRVPWLSGSPPSLVEEAMAPAVAASYSAARQWFVNSISGDVIFPYYFDPIQGVYSYSNSMIRQLMSSRLLAQMAGEDPSLAGLHRRNLDFILNYWYRENSRGHGIIFYDGESELGANAMALRTLCASPFFPQHEKEAEKIYQGIVYLFRDDGFKPFYHEPRYSYLPAYTLAYFSGEAILAITDYARRTGNAEVWEKAAEIQEFYLKKYVDEIEENYYPAYVPWQTFSLCALYAHDPKPEYAEAVFVLNDKLMKIQRHGRHLGRFLDLAPDRPSGTHSSSDAVFTESLAYAYELSQRLGETGRKERYGRALAIAVYNLLRLQYVDLPPNAPYRKFIAGAFRSSAQNPGVRLDSVQHVMDAFRKILPVLGKEIPRGEGVAPSVADHDRGQAAQAGKPPGPGS